MRGTQGRSREVVGSRRAVLGLWKRWCNRVYLRNWLSRQRGKLLLTAERGVGGVVRVVVADIVGLHQRVVQGRAMAGMVRVHPPKLQTAVTMEHLASAVVDPAAIGQDVGEGTLLSKLAVTLGEVLARGLLGARLLVVRERTGLARLTRTLAKKFTRNVVEVFTTRWTARLIKARGDAGARRQKLGVGRHGCVRCGGKRVRRGQTPASGGRAERRVRLEVRVTAGVGTVQVERAGGRRVGAAAGTAAAGGGVGRRSGGDGGGSSGGAQRRRGRRVVLGVRERVLAGGTRAEQRHGLRGRVVLALCGRAVEAGKVVVVGRSVQRGRLERRFGVERGVKANLSHAALNRHGPGRCLLAPHSQQRPAAALIAVPGNGPGTRSQRRGGRAGPAAKLDTARRQPPIARSEKRARTLRWDAGCWRTVRCPEALAFRDGAPRGYPRRGGAGRCWQSLTRRARLEWALVCNWAAAGTEGRRRAGGGQDTK